MGKAPPTTEHETTETKQVNDRESAHMKPMSNKEAIEYALKFNANSYRTNMRRVRSTGGESGYAYWSWDRKKKPRKFNSHTAKRDYDMKKLPGIQQSLPRTGMKNSSGRYNKPQTFRTVCLMHNSVC